MAPSLLQLFLEKGMVTKTVCNISILLLLLSSLHAWHRHSKKRNLGDGWALLDSCNILMKILNSADYLAVHSCLVWAPCVLQGASLKGQRGCLYRSETSPSCKKTEGKELGCAGAALSHVFRERTPSRRFTV